MSVLGRWVVSLFSVVALAACSDGDDANFENPQPVLSSIEISPASAEVPVGLQQVYTATGVYTDGSRRDVSATVTWASEDPAIASINEEGLATGLAEGEATITAAQEGVEGEASLTVTEAELRSLGVFPPQASLKRGTTQDYRAFAQFSDGRIVNVTFDEDAVWELENDSGIIEAYGPPPPDPGDLADFGTAIGIDVGEDVLRVRYLGFEARSAVAVSEDTLVSLVVEPRS